MALDCGLFNRKRFEKRAVFYVAEDCGYSIFDWTQSGDFNANIYKLVTGL